MQGKFTLKINDKTHEVATDGERPLLDVLREDLALTGTKYGCGEGACGTCTVIVDGNVTRSCITSIGEVAGGSVETIEGLAADAELHRLQQAFIDKEAMQCGYCVPGQIMAAVALLRETPRASREEIVSAMNDNICRCCNYVNIRAAIEQAASAS
jgi:aerobic-type carbon monoxide dehydrogenase small subunit (CoxS/CutS family)